MDYNLEHIIAIIGTIVVGTVLVMTGHAEAGVTLYGGVIGYAFKNGVKKVV